MKKTTKKKIWYCIKFFSASFFVLALLFSIWVFGNGVDPGKTIYGLAVIWCVLGCVKTIVLYATVVYTDWDLCIETPSMWPRENSFTYNLIDNIATVCIFVAFGPWIPFMLVTDFD